MVRKALVAVCAGSLLILDLLALVGAVARNGAFGALRPGTLWLVLVVAGWYGVYRESERARLLLGLYYAIATLGALVVVALALGRGDESSSLLAIMAAMAVPSAVCAWFLLLGRPSESAESPAPADRSRRPPSAAGIPRAARSGVLVVAGVAALVLVGGVVMWVVLFARLLGG